MAEIKLNILVKNSITNTLSDEKLDNEKPFTFLEFLNYTSVLNKTTDNTNEYRFYLKEWQSASNKKIDDYLLDVKQQFLNFLSEIKLKYSTKEEKRFLENLDFNNEEHISIAVPFYTRKIKEIVLYFADKKKTITKDLEYIKQKGSIQGIEQYIKDELINIFTGDDTDPPVSINKNLSSLYIDVSVEVENIYDIFNDYYDLDPNKPPQFYDTESGSRLSYFTSNTNYISANYFLDEDEVINELINRQDISLTEIPELLISLNSTDISLLEDYNFIDYRNTNRQNIKYQLDIELIQKYMGVDMYYLSTNSATEYLSGKLFEASEPYKNLLNVNNPATLNIKGDNFKSTREVGLFYKPTNFSLLKLTSKYIYEVDKDKIEPNTVYIFPDPEKYGNVAGVGGVERVTPLTFTLLDSERKNYSSSFGESLVKSSNTNQNFYSYSSLEQDNRKVNNEQPLQGIETINLSGSLVKVSGDIFGNKFNIFNNNNFVNKNLLNPSFISSPLNFTDTEAVSLSTGIKENIYDVKNNTKKIFVLNSVTRELSALEKAFENVFSRYNFNSELIYQINNNLLDFNVFNNTFVLKTSSYHVVDSYNYNSDGTFASNAFISYIKTYNTNITTLQNITTISNISNPYRVDDNIYYVKVESDPSLPQPINERYYVFSIYKYDLTTNKETNVVTSNTQNLEYFQNNFTFSIPTNIVQVKDIKLSYNKKQNKFLIVSNFSDLNNANLYHILIFKIRGNTVEIFKNYIIGPSNFYSTANFYKESELDNNFLVQNFNSTITQDLTYGTINI
jgi:hypothetical protein